MIIATTVEEAPVIDGRLDDPVWQGVPGASEFYQKEPVEGEAATEATTVHILYDRAYLYIGVELLDSDPVQIRASELQRDSTLDNDDSFTVAVDSFHDHRNAFVFRLNALGIRYDALIQEESKNLDRAWDEQWTAAAVRTDQGWSAEFSIPFNDLPPRASPPSKLDLGPLEVHSREQNRVLETWGVWPPAPAADRPRRCEAVSGCTPFATSRLTPLLPTTCRRSRH